MKATSVCNSDGIKEKWFWTSPRYIHFFLLLPSSISMLTPSFYLSSFTNMLKNKAPSVVSVRATMQQQHLASARNRRLAQQMENRPSVQAALHYKQVRHYSIFMKPTFWLQSRLILFIQKCEMIVGWLHCKDHCEDVLCLVTRQLCAIMYHLSTGQAATKLVYSWQVHNIVCTYSHVSIANLRR